MSETAQSKELYQILQTDDAQGLQELLSGGFPVNTVDDSQNTALHDAAWYGAADCVHVLLKAGADVTRCNKYKETALHKAADSWKLFLGAACRAALCVSLLLQAGAICTAKDSSGETPLEIAQKKGNYATSCLLRQEEISPKSPVMQAVWANDSTALRTILEEHTDKSTQKKLVNAVDKFGYTPLHIAALPGRASCLPLLLEAGAKPNAVCHEGITPLLLATETNQADTVRALLAAGASTEQADAKQYTPLMLAAKEGYEECVKLLLAAGAKVNKSNFRQDTALNLSVGNPGIMQLLLKAGAKPDSADKNGMTPLATSASSSGAKNVACSRLLIAAGANVNYREKRGIPPIYWACSMQHNENLRVLLEAGADVNLCGQNGLTPLHGAAMARNSEAIKLLLAAGADPAKKDKEGKTPREYARGKAGKECRDLLTTPQQKKGVSSSEKSGIKLHELRRKIHRKAVLFRSTAAAQAPEGMESCLGLVTRQRPGETQPTDAAGQPLEPLATIFVKDLPHIPAALKKVALITIFAPQDALSADPDKDPMLSCVIRTYESTDELEVCHYASGTLTPCILTPEAVANDMPKYPDCGGSTKWWNQVQEMERAQDLDYAEDILEANYETHKLGGYPTYTQGAPDLPGGYSYVLQICSDDTAGLSIGDAGAYYFFYNPRKNSWRVHADCY